MSLTSTIGRIGAAAAGLTGITDLFGLTGALLLGGVSFRDFEVPESIAWGGAQQVTVHKLPGGLRVIDSMGRDDRNSDWSGIFLSADASSRAMQIDQLRIAGDPVSLSWGDFTFDVVITSFNCDYRRDRWIPYQISCTVLQDQSESSLLSFVSTALAIGNDLYAAAQSMQALSPPSPPNSTTAADEAAVTAAAAASAAAILAAQTASTAAVADDFHLGSASYTAGVLALQAAQAATASGVAIAGTNLLAVASSGNSAGDLLALLYMGGELAQMAQAQGYVGRATVNAITGSC